MALNHSPVEFYALKFKEIGSFEHNFIKFDAETLNIIGFDDANEFTNDAQAV